MKKLTALISAALLAFTFTGCSQSSGSSSSSVSESSEEESAVYQGPVSFEVIQPFINYFEGFNIQDPDMAIAAITPQGYIEALKNSGRYEVLYNDNKRDIDATQEYWRENYGKDVVGKYVSEITNIPLTKTQLKCAERCYEYSYYDVKVDIEIEEGYEVQFKYSISGEKDSTEGEETACFVKVKDDGWKMLALPAEVLEEYKVVE